MSFTYEPMFQERMSEFAINPAQAAGSYTVCTASGDIAIKSAYVYIANACTGLTSVAIQSNSTTPNIIMTAAQGAVASLTADRTIALTAANLQPWTLRAGRSIRFTIVGTGAAGAIRLGILWCPVTVGGTLA